MLLNQNTAKTLEKQLLNYIGSFNAWKLFIKILDIIDNNNYYQLKIIKLMKKVLKKLHLWLGLTFGIPLVILGITGSIIILSFSFSDIKRIVSNAESYNPSPQEIIEIINLVKEGEVSELRFPEKIDGTMSIRLSNKKRFSLNLQTMVMEPDLQDSFTRIMIKLHSKLLLSNGDFITGISGIILFFLSISGMILSIPKIFSLKDVKLKMHLKGKPFYYNLHTVIGFWAFLFLIIMSFSGVYLTFPDGLAKPVKNLLQVKPFKLEEDFQASLQSFEMEKIIFSAKNAIPNARITRIYLPSKSNNYFNITMKQGLFPVKVFLDNAGNILQIKKSETYTIGEKIAFLIPYLHKNENVSGIWWGWRIIIFIIGFLPIVFTFTGFKLWRKRNNRFLS